MNKKAYILFTRVPIPNKVKTRLQSLLSGEEACQVQKRLLQDQISKFSSLNREGIDLFVAYSDEGDPSELLIALPGVFQTFGQKGMTIGERMNHAMRTVYAKGYEKVVLTGSDIPNLSSEIICSAFDRMQEVVFGPSPDGGYYLVGAQKSIDLTPIFEADIAWGKKDVLKETLKLLREVDVALLSPLKDIDYPTDLKAIRRDLALENRYLRAWLDENRRLLE